MVHMVHMAVCVNLEGPLRALHLGPNVELKPNGPVADHGNFAGKPLWR